MKLAQLNQNSDEDIMLTHVSSLQTLSRERRRKYIERCAARHNLTCIRDKHAECQNMLINVSNEPEIYITAHYDSCANLPGANDNLSGCAVVLALFSRIPLLAAGRNIALILFDEEERALRGSRAFCKTNGGASRLGALNLEMVGSGDIVAAWGMPASSCKMVEALSEAATSSGIRYLPMSISLPLQADHLAFVENGVREALSLTCVTEEDLAVQSFWTSAGSASGVEQWRVLMRAPLFKHYHRPSDIAANLKRGSMDTVLRLLTQYLKVNLS